MAEDGTLAGMDEEGVRRLLGELLASARGVQANFDEIRQQFPVQPGNVADSIPTWQELEEGGLEPPNPEEGEGESFQEQLGLEGFSDLLWVEISATGAILRGGEGLTVEHPSTGIYKIWMQTKTQEDFNYPGSIESCNPSTAGTQAINSNVNLITSKEGVKGWEIVLVKDVAGTTYADSSFHFFAANLGAE